MEQNNVAVKISQLSKTIKHKQLLKPLNYQLSKSKILALCGGNGAGKSTLIRLIIGLTKATTGSVTVNGLSKRKNKEQFLKQIGYMPDNFHFQKSMTTKETIKFYARIKKVSEASYKEVLKTVGLFDRMNEKVGNFSKGMTQRLLLAQALLSEPSLLVLDEPTNGLDPYWIKQFCKLLIKAKENQQTVIFSTHDLHVAEKIADEVIFLHDGKVMSKGPINNYQKDGLYETFQQIYFDSLHNEEQTNVTLVSSTHLS
ncbi:MAG TPA: ABC transporter ATP-binding protein [Pseudogracilibacillus sp.]|nr:ABC transporter ATP-binding protein [Pseudogracilibacillus sp.]